MGSKELYNHLRDRRYFNKEAREYVKKVKINFAKWQRELDRVNL